MTTTKTLYSVSYHNNAVFYHLAKGDDTNFIVSTFWLDTTDNTWQTYYDHVDDWPMTMADYLDSDDLVDKATFDLGVQKLLDHILLKDKD